MGEILWNGLKYGMLAASAIASCVMTLVIVSPIVVWTMALIDRLFSNKEDPK